MKGKTQQAAAAASDMSERSVRNWNKGPLPSEKKDRRRQRTRPDPFAGVWAEEVEPLLEADVDRILAAPTVLEWLDERHPGRFNASHLRTLQRRLRDWRTLHGPEREVYFEQEHPPGREAQMDSHALRQSEGDDRRRAVCAYGVRVHTESFGLALRADMLQRDCDNAIRPSWLVPDPQ